MITTLDSLNISTLPIFIDWLIIAKQNSIQLESELGTKYLQNSLGTFWFKPENSIFSLISVHYTDSKIESINIGGKFDLTFQHLQEQYSLYNIHYSHYDDLYFHCFQTPKVWLEYKSETDCTKFLEANTHLIREIGIRFK